MAVSGDAYAPGGSRSARRWAWQEILTGIALILLVVNLAVYVLVLLRRFLLGP